MPFVISAGTFLTGLGPGIQSVNLDLNPQINRLFQLGSTDPYDRTVILQKRLTVNVYGGSASTPSYSVVASTTCDDANTLELSITAAGCDGLIQETDDWYVTGYSYSKDITGWGIQTWNFVSRPILKDVVAGELVDNPDSIQPNLIRGIAEGQTTTDGGADTGIVFSTALDLVPGTNIQVQAGSPGIGRANEINFGEVVTVGGLSTGKADGKDGSASVSVPYTPVYIQP